jgi:chromosomal replication initiation ATPase DnaA
MTLRERAIEIVRRNADEDNIELSEEDFNYAVEQVRSAIARAEGLEASYYEPPKIEV